MLLARLLRVVDAGPRPFFQAAMVSLAATAVRAFRLHYPHWEPIRLPFWGPRFWLLLSSPAKLGIPGCKRHPRDPCVARQGVVVPVSRP